MYNTTIYNDVTASWILITTQTSHPVSGNWSRELNYIASPLLHVNARNALSSLNR